MNAKKGSKLHQQPLPDSFGATRTIMMLKGYHTVTLVASHA
ncbi:hypothetical protein [Paenibacillus sp. 1001270B_150601_E10]|nr:hypothetical protein [Paenibacillus sp. 1001270B_150601_E10]